MAIDRTRIASIIESLIFVSDTPLSFRKIRSILDGVPAKDLRDVIDGLAVRYREEGRGILLEEVSEGFQMRTPPENQEWVKMLIEYKPIRLSKASLETLSIIAYQQPTTKTDVEAIRGVDSSSAVAKLLELGLIKILGRREIPGRPFVYGTTPEFLEVFNLKSLGDLPTLREIEDLSAQEIEAYSDKLAEVAGEKVETAEDAEKPENADVPTNDGESVSAPVEALEPEEEAVLEEALEPEEEAVSEEVLEPEEEAVSEEALEPEEDEYEEDDEDEKDEEEDEGEDEDEAEPEGENESP